VREIALRTLREFWEQHPDARSALEAWYSDARRATWKAPSDIKGTYRNASIVGRNRVVFNLKGNSYQLVVAVQYEASMSIVSYSYVSAVPIGIMMASMLRRFERCLDTEKGNGIVCIKPIKTYADSRAALADVEQLCDAAPATPAGDRPDVLVAPIEAYEAKHYKIPLPDPVAAI